VIRKEDGWDVYGAHEIVSKITYSMRKKAFVKLAFSGRARQKLLKT
jgi:hypothetical protein